ncbi:MAG: hypothetical protein PVI21_00020 [Candidatus Woesebacteria bacterium]|jgi:hypothetical protein
MSLACGKTIAIILSTLLILFAGISYLFNRLSNNLAENVARPIEKSLVEAGAVKMCSGGDAGHGPDNFSPWYYAVFTVNGTLDEAQQIARSVTEKNGYNLGEFNEDENKSYLYSRGSKPSEYENLKSGDVGIAFNINLKAHYDPDVDDEFCSFGNAVGLEDGKASFVLFTGLPEYKTPSFFQL